MTIEEADKIRIVWGKFLEHMFGKINLTFGGKIPESLLPYPKDVLMEALEIIHRHSYDIGDKRMMGLMEETSALLNTFINDEEAFISAGEKFNNPKWRESFVPALKNFQKEWIQTQDAPGF